MKLFNGHSLLLAERETPNQAHRVRVVKNLSDALKGWKPSSRLSPIFRVGDIPPESPSECNFRGDWHLLFLGPVNPCELEPLLEKGMLFWITLGLYNTVVAARSTRAKRALSNLRKWAAHNRVSTELWVLKNGNVDRTEISVQEPTNTEWRKLVVGAFENLTPDSFDASEEFRVLMANALARCGSQLPPDSPLAIHLGSVLRSLPDYVPKEASRSLAALAEINAGASRLSSQAFSGASPILDTECHFWTHSLLGIGIPILSLLNLVNFLHRTLAEARLPQRILRLSTIKENVNFIKLEKLSNPLWKRHYLVEAGLDKSNQAEELAPIIPYYSGRDGFKATEYTISAPLGIVSSCSSQKWTLRTLTHEAIHAVVGGSLSAILPDLTNVQQSKRILDLLNNRRPPADLLEDAQLLLVHYFDDLDKALHSDFPHTGDPVVKWDLDNLDDLLFGLRHEVEETMVHAFDFLYFYRRDPAEYVRTVWNSLESIPALTRKVPQFVMRTMAATAIPWLDHKNPELKVYEQMCGLLKQIGGSNGKLISYRHLALDYLTRRWQKRSWNELTARIWVANFVRTFFYLPDLEIQLAETHVATSKGSAGKKKTYPHKPMVLDITSPIADPIGFAASFAKHNADFARSAWLLTTLAFGAIKNDKPIS